MGDLESQEEDVPKCVLWYKPMTWLGVISPHHRDDSLPETPGLLDSVRPFLPRLWVLRYQLLRRCHHRFLFLFRTTHRVRTQQVGKIRGQWCEDIELAVHLPVWHDGTGSLGDVTYASHITQTNPSLNGQCLGVFWFPCRPSFTPFPDTPFPRPNLFFLTLWK